MNTNPINLTIRFLLEMAMLVVLACWGWQWFTGWPRYIATPGLPLLAVLLWGIFRIAHDPKPAPVEVPGLVRLLLEWFLFGFAVWALYSLQRPQLGLIMALLVVIHYIVSYDRTLAMLRNKPYDGFIK